MRWQSPTKDEFDRDWLTPGAASQRTPTKGGHTKKRWIAERLASGAIEAVARSGQTSARDKSPKPFIPVPADHWEGWDFENDALFWKTGDLVRTIYTGAGGYGSGAQKYRYHEVRFKPDGFPRVEPPQPSEAEMLARNDSKNDDTPAVIPKEEFHRWLQPAVVWRRLHQPHKGDALATAILNRLRQGKIRAAAELVIVKLSKAAKEEESEFVTITRRLWRMAQVSSPSHRLWTFGEFAVAPNTAAEEAWGRDNPGVWATFTGVRFEPIGVADLADAMGIAFLTGQPLNPKPPDPEPRPAPPDVYPGGITWVDEAYDTKLAAVRDDGAGAMSPAPRTRAPSVKAARPPDDDAILAKADELRARGMTSYDIAKRMRLEPGFENVATRSVRELIRGRYPRPGRAGI